MKEAQANGLWDAMEDEDRAFRSRRAILAHLLKDDILLQRGDRVDRVYLPVPGQKQT